MLTLRFVEIFKSLEDLSTKRDDILNRVSEAVRGDLNLEIEAFSTLKRQRKPYQISKFELSFIYARICDIFENDETLVSGDESELEVMAKMMKTYNWAKNLVEGMHSHVHRSVDNSGARHRGKSFSLLLRPQNIHEQRCAVCSHMSINQQFSNDAIAIATENAKKEWMKKLEDYNTKEPVSKKRKPSPPAEKQHLLCFCYQLNCLNCPSCDTTSTSGSLCDCAICQCQCRVSYPRRMRDIIEMELKPNIRTVESQSLLTRSLPMLPPENLINGSIRIDRQLSHTDQEKLQAVVPSPTFLLNNGRDIRDIFPPTRHHTPSSSLDFPQQSGCSSSSSSSLLTPPPLSSASSSVGLATQEAFSIPEIKIQEIRKRLRTDALDETQDSESCSVAKKLWEATHQADSNVMKLISNLYKEEPDISVQKVLRFLKL